MYNGEVNVTEEFLPVLLKTAETLRICGLSTGNDATKDDEVSLIFYTIYGLHFTPKIAPLLSYFILYDLGIIILNKVCCILT